MPDVLLLGESVLVGKRAGFLNISSCLDVAYLQLLAHRLCKCYPRSELRASQLLKFIRRGIIHACISIGQLCKAHSILDEMNALGGSVGLGVY
ncbi:hypothetical protein VNO77_42246 [Canavalia gladiata]|uniref:Pentatricopeptide repeat-containing protein n=1 Tax=Canavalia gladiata TaxID=3824 RepID=A0AAN9PSN6_CANGL